MVRPPHLISSHIDYYYKLNSFCEKSLAKESQLVVRTNFLGVDFTGLRPQFCYHRNNQMVHAKWIKVIKNSWARSREQWHWSQIAIGFNQLRWIHGDQWQKLSWKIIVFPAKEQQLQQYLFNCSAVDSQSKPGKQSQGIEVKGTAVQKCEKCQKAGNPVVMSCHVRRCIFRQRVIVCYVQQC